jgi:hypothetical protein
MLFFRFCIVSLLEEQTDTNNHQQGEGGEGNRERGTTNNNNRPSHARKQKEGNGICFSHFYFKCTL